MRRGCHVFLTSVPTTARGWDAWEEDDNTIRAVLLGRVAQMGQGFVGWQGEGRREAGPTAGLKGKRFVFNFG